jgi:short-subunit dehydrogenase
MNRVRDWSRETVWILGASSGIGRALAEELAARGARLVLSARESERFTAAVEACRKHVDVSAEPVDLSDAVEVHRVCARLEAREEAVTTVIYAAGVSQRAVLLDASEEVVDRVLAVNFRSAVTVGQRLGRRLAARGGGRIAFVSSLAGYAPTPLRSIYSASKSALGVMAASLRAELSRSGVGVTLLVPGFVRTAMSESALRADGAAYGVTDPNQEGGMEPSACARQIIRGIERGREEVWVALGFKGRLALALGRVAPRLQRRLLARVPTTAAEA